MAEESRWRRIFVNIYTYTLAYAIFGVLSLSYHACFNSSLTTLEKRYHFSSSTGGYIMITDNVATVLTNLFIGYYGRTAHKPRCMAIGCFVTGLSVMITALPYFIYGTAQDAELELMMGNITLARSNSGDQTCLAQAQIEDCSQVKAIKTMTMVAVACFGLSNFFRGFGTSIYFTFGTPYLDDNVSKAKMPTFFAFTFAARILGAPIGFYLSWAALKFYENPFHPPPNLSPSDPRWIGAWWIGFLISGFLMLLLTIPLSMFPREFKKKSPEQERGEVILSLVERKENEGTISNSNERLNGYQAVESTAVADSDDLKKPSNDLRNMPRELMEIITNPLIVCQMMGNMFRGVGIIGYFVFQSRYLEAQFRQSASEASKVTGTTGFLGKLSGVFIGGLFITMGRPGPRLLTTFIFLVELTSVFALLYAASVAGPQYEYPETALMANGQRDLLNTCNKNCFCEHVRYQPVCEHLEKKAYFSPCHAGCTTSFKTADKSSTFTNCRCVKHQSQTVEPCPGDTENLYHYATIIAVGGMISGSARSGNMVTFFRSIRPDQKTLTMAVGSFWHSLVVSIPYPIIYGKLFDFCCLVWSRECNKSGNCWLYDTEKLRYVYHGLSIVLVALGSVFDLIMIFLSPRLGKLYDEEDEQTSFKERLMFWRRKKRSEISKKPADSGTQELPPVQPALPDVSAV